MGVKFHISRSKGVFWSTKNVSSFKSGQISRVDWNLSGAHLLDEQLFLCDCQFMRYDRFCIFLLRGLAEIYRIFFFWPWSFAPSHPPPEHSSQAPDALGLTLQSEQDSVNDIFRKATLRYLILLKYKIDNNSETENHTKNTHEYKNSDQNIAHLLFFRKNDLKHLDFF